MDDLLNGDGSVADYLQNSGGGGSPYIANQDPFSILDNGYLYSDAGTTTDASGTPTGTSGGSSSATPGWFDSILSLAGQAAGTAATQTITPLINGKPAGSPSPVSGQTVAAGMSSSTLLLIAAAIIAFFFLSKRRA